MVKTYEENELLEKGEVKSREFVYVSSELQELFGQDFIMFLSYCNRNYFPIYEEIREPKVLKVLIELYLEFIVRYKGFHYSFETSYENIIENYNRLVENKFDNTKSLYKLYNQLTVPSRPDRPYLIDDLTIKNKQYSFLDFENYGDFEFIRESVFESVLFYNLAKLENNINVYQQARTKYGKVDGIIDYGDKRVILELKKGDVKRKDIYQVYDYWATEGKDVRKNTEKVIVGKSFSNDVIELCKLLDVKCYDYLLFPVFDVRIQMKIEGIRHSELFDNVLKNISNKNGHIVFQHPAFEEDFVKVLDRFSNKIKDYRQEHKEALGFLKKEYFGANK